MSRCSAHCPAGGHRPRWLPGALLWAEPVGAPTALTPAARALEQAPTVQVVAFVARRDEQEVA